MLVDGDARDETTGERGVVVDAADAARAPVALADCGEGGCVFAISHFLRMLSVFGIHVDQQIRCRRNRMEGDTSDREIRPRGRIRK